MNHVFKRTALIFVFSLSITSCANSAEETALECVRALCDGDEDALRSLVTEDSFRLYQGLHGTVPQAVACQAGEVSVVSSRVVDEEGSMVRVALEGASDATQSVMVHRRQGTWRVDLFMIGWDDTVGMGQTLFPSGGGR